jgi:flagellar FliL protein
MRMDKADVEGEVEGKWSRKRWRPGVVALALIVPVAAGVARHLFQHSASTPQQKDKAEPKVRAVLHLEPFVVNLADPEGDRLLRVGIDLGLEREVGENSRAGQGEIPIARTRDAILTVLTTRNAQGLVAPEGKTNLKDELVKALHEHAPELEVREVYFTEFLVQR